MLKDSMQENARTEWPSTSRCSSELIVIHGTSVWLPQRVHQAEFELQICKPSTMSKPPESLSDRIRAIIQIWRNGSGGQQVAKHRQQVGKRIISTASGPLAILHWKVVAVETSESGTKTPNRTFESRNFGPKV